MAFSKRNFSIYGGGGGGGALCQYKTADDISDIETNGYFDDMADTLHTGDILVAQCADGVIMRSLTVTTGDVALGAAPNQAANVADASSGSAAEINALRDALVASGLMASS